MARRKKNYQSLDQIIEQNEVDSVDTKTRMAGDQVIADLLSEKIEEDKQINYLAQQLGRFGEIDASFERAGVPHQEVTALQVIRKLANGVPAPFIGKASNGNERRVHTQVVKNPFTGEMEIAPFNNVRTGEALVTEFGRNVNLEGEDKASEYVQDHILRLMGYNPRRGPKGKIDFLVEKGDQTIGIDGQVQQAGRDPNVELFAKVIPSDRPKGGYGYGYANKGDNTRANEEAIKSKVRMLISNKLKSGIGIKNAMNELMNEGLIKRDRNIDGKLYKDNYDKVLMPIQNARQNIQNRNVGDKIAIAPDKVLGYDLNEIKEGIDNITDNKQIQYAYNAGDTRPQADHQARVKVRAGVPQQFVQDIVEHNPYVAQILKTLNYQ